MLGGLYSIQFPTCWGSKALSSSAGHCMVWEVYVDLGHRQFIWEVTPESGSVWVRMECQGRKRSWSKGPDESLGLGPLGLPLGSVERATQRSSTGRPGSWSIYPRWLPPGEVTRRKQQRSQNTLVQAHGLGSWNCPSQLC